MKKIYYVLSVICLLFVISACSKETNKGYEILSDKRQVSKEINENLVHKLVGDWVGDVDGNYPVTGKKTIVNKDGYILYDNEPLQITSTEGDTIFTQTKDEKAFYYHFKLNGDELTVYRSYPTPEGSVGGELAPESYKLEE